MFIYKYDKYIGKLQFNVSTIWSQQRGQQFYSIENKYSIEDHRIIETSNLDTNGEVDK